MALEATYLAARYDGDLPAARRHLAAAGPVPCRVTRARSEAAILLLEGRVGEAGRLLAAAAGPARRLAGATDPITRAVLAGLRELNARAAAAPAPAGVAAYLDDLCQRLVALPYGRRTEVREEVGQHLAALAADRPGLGPAEVAGRCGDPGKVARALLRAQPAARPWAAMRAGLGWFAGAAAGLAAGVGLAAGAAEVGSDAARAVGLVAAVGVVAAGVVLPVVAGWKTGAAAPEWAGTGAVLAVAVLAAAGVLVALPFHPAAAAMLVLLAVLWATLGYTAARLASDRALRRRAAPEAAG